MVRCKSWKVPLMIIFLQGVSLLVANGLVKSTTKSLEVSDEYKINSDKTEIKVSIFEDLVIDIRNVFKWWLN